MNDHEITFSHKILHGLTMGDRLLEMPKDCYSVQITNDGKTEVWYDPYEINCLLCRSWCYPLMPDTKPCFECTECGFVFEVDFCASPSIVGKKIVLNYGRNSRIIDNDILEDL